MSYWSPESFKNFCQPLWPWLDPKVFWRLDHFDWPGDLTWGDLGLKCSEKVGKGCPVRYTKNGGAHAAVFALSPKNRRGGGGVKTPPPPLGRGMQSQYQRYEPKFDSKEKPANLAELATRKFESWLKTNFWNAMQVRSQAKNNKHSDSLVRW